MNSNTCNLHAININNSCPGCEKDKLNNLFISILELQETWNNTPFPVHYPELEQQITKLTKQIRIATVNYIPCDICGTAAYEQIAGEWLCDDCQNYDKNRQDNA